MAHDTELKILVKLCVLPQALSLNWHLAMYSIVRVTNWSHKAWRFLPETRMRPGGSVVIAMH